MIRAVLDTNVIVSGVISQAGPPGQLLRGALEAGMFLLVTSPMLLEEVAETLWEENIRKYHRWHQNQLLAFLGRLHRHSQVTPGQLQVQVIADDPDDNAVLACAMEGADSHRAPRLTASQQTSSGSWGACDPPPRAPLPSIS
jgi:hypothetical protein